MNLYRGIFALLILATLSNACTKSHAGVSKPDPTPEEPAGGTTDSGYVAGTGTPIGTAVAKIIGSDGGSLVSDDQHLTLYVAPGAASQSQSVTLQRITNQAPNGLGDAYRIKPATTMQKPFKVCWRYNKQLLKGAKPTALAIAYQDAKGIWHAGKQTNIDEQDSTICVELRNGQPADISFICETIMVPQIGQKSRILTQEPIFIDINRVPIQGNWAELPAATIVKDGIVHLYVNGGDPNDGSLGNGTVAEAAYGSPHSLLYVGPDHLPSPNPVIIHAEVRTANASLSAETFIPVGQELSMNSTVGGLTNPLSTFLAGEGGNLSITLWSDTDLENSPNVTSVTITGFTKNRLTYTSGPGCEFQLAGGGKVYNSIYYPVDDHGVPVKTYGAGTLTITSITALVDHPGIGIIEGNWQSEVFRAIGGNKYERGTVSTHFQMVGGYLP